MADIDLVAEALRCITELDVPGMRRLHAYRSPHLPSPGNDHEVLAALHNARTKLDAVPQHLRFYSHRWLTDRGFPSMLPDELKPKAEQIHPRVVTGVGLVVSSMNPEMQPAADLIRKAMEDAVNEAYAEGKTDPIHVKLRMEHARKREMRKLMIPNNNLVEL